MDDANHDLLAAAASADEAGIKQALNHGANANSTRYETETALGLLLQQYKRSTQEERQNITRAVTALLEHGADANALHHGFTPLQIAVGQQSEILTTRLITYGASPDMETKAGSAPIWQAVYNNDYKTGLILLQAGANPNIPNEKNMTPLQYLRSCGFQKTRLMLHLRYYGGH